MNTISFKVPNETFERFMALSQHFSDSEDQLLRSAFEDYLDNMQDCISAKAVWESNEPFLTLEELRKEINFLKY